MQGAFTLSTNLNIWPCTTAGRQKLRHTKRVIINTESYTFVLGRILFSAKMIWKTRGPRTTYCILYSWFSCDVMHQSIETPTLWVPGKGRRFDFDLGQKASISLPPEARVQIKRPYPWGNKDEKKTCIWTENFSNLRTFTPIATAHP